MFNARIRALRRVWHKQISLRPLINDFEAEYRRLELPGLVMPEPENDTNFFDTISPHPRTGNRALKHWTSPFRPNGPIGLLCQNTHMRATAFTKGWDLCSKRRIPVNVIHTPTNHLTKLLRHLHDTAGFWVMPISRKTFRGHPAIDVHTSLALARANQPTTPDEDDGTDRTRRLHARGLAFHAALGIDNDTRDENITETQSRKAPHPKAPLLLSILTGELWDIQTFERAGLHNSDQCLLCGKAIGSFEHTTWQCLKNRKVRDMDPHINALNITPEALPDTIKNQGWAPSMTADPVNHSGASINTV